MPIYDYACQSCGHQMEVVHGVHDSGPSECPVCGGAMRKLLSAPAIVFKGSGWAKKERTSSARQGGAPHAPSGKSDATGGAGPGEKSPADTTTASQDGPAGGTAKGAV